MYRNRKGFTIVELVIVIAVIAILAAVLIPTFSSLTQRANLSSDMQAVRQMNMALQNDEALNGKCTNVEQAMQVIANAGYDVDRQWSCLTDGYVVYWYKTDNRCVLVNKSTMAVEYPKEYTSADLIADAGNFEVYNQTYKNALSQDLTLSSGATSSTGANLSSGSTNDQTVSLGSSSVTISKNVLGALSSMNLGNSNIYGYKSQENSGAKLESMAVGNLTSDGTITPNVYYISTTTSANATAEEKLEAQKTAGSYVYSIFVQMNSGSVDSDANIVLAPGTEINISDREWQPVKLFKGYFGTTNASEPVVINGLNLDAISYLQTYTFTGSGSTYYLSGFFGGVTSDAGEETVIENVVFKNIHIETPASDYSAAAPDKSDSNCTAIIGGIIATAANDVVDVTLRNIKAENSSVHGVARVGGLVAYIGGYIAGSNYGLSGNITIEGCDINMDVSTDKVTGYGTCGGIVGFINKTYDGTGLNINITNTKFTGTLKGVYCGGIVANYSPTNTETQFQNVALNISGCTVNATGTINAGAVADAVYNPIVGMCIKLTEKITYTHSNNSPEA